MNKRAHSWGENSTVSHIICTPCQLKICFSYGQCPCSVSITCETASGLLRMGKGACLFWLACWVVGVARAQRGVNRQQPQVRDYSLLEKGPCQISSCVCNAWRRLQPVQGKKSAAHKLWSGVTHYQDRNSTISCMALLWVSIRYFMRSIPELVHTACHLSSIGLYRSILTKLNESTFSSSVAEPKLLV